MARTTQPTTTDQLREQLAADKLRLRDIEQRLGWLEVFNETHDDCLASRVPEAETERARLQTRIDTARKRLAKTVN